MKKINIALMILSGLAMVGLTGCGGSDDDKEPTVVNVTTPAPTTNNNSTSPAPKQEEPKKEESKNPTDCSGFAGTYKGEMTIPIDSQLTAMPDATIKIGSNCGINSDAVGVSGAGSAFDLTATSFNYKIQWNNSGIESGTCNYKSGSLNCNGTLDATATKYNLTK